jgi:hypothetical protein
MRWARMWGAPQGGAVGAWPRGSGVSDRIWEIRVCGAANDKGWGSRWDRMWGRGSERKRCVRPGLRDTGVRGR